MTMASSNFPNLFDLVEASNKTDAVEWIVNFAVVNDEPPGSDTGPFIWGVGASVCSDEGPLEDESDVRLKTDIEQVGTTVYGLPLYHFRYKKGPERFEGVMAQDVLKVMPDAVVMGENGHYRVNYGKLGIAMKQL